VESKRRAEYAPSEFNPPRRSDIDAYTRRNGVGMVLGDIEWTQLSNINIADYKIGV
jgi:hypothetical protein